MWYIFYIKNPLDIEISIEFRRVGSAEKETSLTRYGT